jgi:alkyl hydroperoxide reductase subunit AhpF
MESKIPQFDDETWAMLPAFFDRLPEPVLLNIWGDANASDSESEAVDLVDRLSVRFDSIDYQVLPRRIDFHYYPVIGVMRLSGDDPIDNGVRIVGLPVGYQMTSLIAAVQSVSFQGVTAEAKTRIQLHGLRKAVTLELFTAAHDQAGAVVAQAIFNMAVASVHVRSFVVMADVFPGAAMRYSVGEVPHLVINGRSHIQGVVDESVIMEQIAAVVKRAK